MYAFYQTHKTLLEESEKVRKEQEELGPSPPKPAKARRSYVERVWLYWAGEWDGGKLRTLCQEVYFGTPTNALIAAVAVFCGSLASLKKAQARGAMLDIMTAATTNFSVAALTKVALIEPSAIQRLWEWKEGWGGLRILAFWTLMEWCCLVGKDILLGLAKAERGAQSRAVYFASMLRQDMAFHASHPSGELAARLDSDPKVLDELCVHGPERLLQGLVALGTLVWLLAVDPLLLALALCLRLPQLLQVTEMSVRLASAYERLADAQAAKAQARAADCLANVRVIQAHTSEKEEVAGYCKVLSERLRVVQSSAIISPLLRHSEGLVLLVTECALLAFGGLRVMAGSQTLGVFTSRRETTNSVVENFHGLEHVYHMVRRCGLLCGRYLGLRDRVPTIPVPLPIPLPLLTPLVGALPNRVLEGLAREEMDIWGWEGDWEERNKKDGSVQQIQSLRFRGEGRFEPPFSSSFHSSPPRGDITFENVSFSYPVPSSSDANSRQLVLRDVSFHIPGGSVCAFVGPSGGGKTTAGRLLARFYDVTQGRILLDGIDIRAIPVPLLRSWIGMVDQDTTLLSRSVKDNVTLGYKRAGSETECVDDVPLRSALDGALASEFVDVLEGGWNAHVGERGGGLSGGQKQRLGLSRLLLRNPPIAVIDEGTSALDTHCEASIMANLLSSSAARNTRILIAHRYASIQAATIVVVFSGGVIVECGAPEHLLSKGGMFASLVATQIHK
jgi:ABC-type multidrug transport system fused ATPase/permease subunit